MARKRISMRRIREVLRLYFVHNQSQSKISLSCGVSRATIGEYLRRLKATGTTWELCEQYDDNQLDDVDNPNDSKVWAGYWFDNYNDADDLYIGYGDDLVMPTECELKP